MSAKEWLNHLNTVKFLEQQHHRLECGFYNLEEKYGHSIQFTKRNGCWYLQDSHAEKPIRCTPSQFVKYLANVDNSKLTINHQGMLEEYRQHYNLTGGVDINFNHYEPLRT